ncbi:MAG: SUF system Fe-S cluster assembly regulator [Burkholderiaceae bacterium]|nr:SUF system Fe-S cluster assembly regulator [Burkholderiaceae bacterium]
MLRISKLADYGCLVMGLMAQDPAGVHSASSLAGTLGLGLPTVSKVLKALARADLVTGVRGLHGGYILARRPEDISVADIVGALEGNRFALTECGAGSGLCSIEKSCHTRHGWRTIGDTIRRALEETSLASLVRPEEPAVGAGEAAVMIARPMRRAAAAGRMTQSTGRTT